MEGRKLTQLQVVDMHTAGEPVRIVTDGFPKLMAASILDKRREVLALHDDLRRALMHEPRGHAGMYGVIPVQPTAPGAEFAALFMHNAGYSTMCGHATIAIGKWLVESGQVPAVEPETRLAIELPCGVVNVRCEVRDGCVVKTSFDSVPSFLSQQDVRLSIEGLGEVSFDIAYGGAFYAILPSSNIGLDFFETRLERLVEVGAAITKAVREQIVVEHPDADDLGFLYGTILTDDAGKREKSYNLCVFADGQIDRSPTGSGVTARMARDYARGLLDIGDERSFCGATGVPFTARLLSVDPIQSSRVSVTVSGNSAFCGSATFEIYSDDPLGYGFTLPESFGALRRAEAA